MKKYQINMSNLFENRRWMYRRQKPGGGVTKQFSEGVQLFLDYTLSQPDEVSVGEIVCPCARCKFRKMYDRETVIMHLYMKGFAPDYRVWIYHGEIPAENPTNEVLPVAANVNTEAHMNDDFRHMFVDMAEGFSQLHPIVHSEPEQPNPVA